MDEDIKDTEVVEPSVEEETQEAVPEETLADDEKDVNESVEDSFDDKEETT